MTGTVTRVADGDTVHVDSLPENVRFIGVNTPRTR